VLATQFREVCKGGKPFLLDGYVPRRSLPDRGRADAEMIDDRLTKLRTPSLDTSHAQATTGPLRRRPGSAGSKLQHPPFSPLSCWRWPTSRRSLACRALRLKTSPSGHKDLGHPGDGASLLPSQPDGFSQELRRILRSGLRHVNPFPGKASASLKGLRTRVKSSTLGLYLAVRQASLEAPQSSQRRATDRGEGQFARTHADMWRVLPGAPRTIL
jgi:hypothetical protein